MKKVLIIAYDFPPYVSVGGLRPYNWYRYLHEFDIYPIVVTRQWSNKHGSHLDYIEASNSDKVIIEENEKGMIIRTPYKPNFSNRLMLKHGDSRYKFFRKFISAYFEFAQFLFKIGPKSELYLAAKKYLEKNNVDYIIACADPFILFDYASKLSRKFEIPWIADYRDPWTLNFVNQKNFLLRTWNSYLEKRILKNVQCITTVSEFLKFNISTIIRDKKYYILPNGYSPEIIKQKMNNEQQGSALSIAFVGTIYLWYPIRSFFSVISDFLLSNDTVDLIVNFYGVNIPVVLNDMISKDFPHIKCRINIFPRIPHELLIEELCRNNVMLLFNSFYHMGTKIYDYIGIKRKIILCYSDDSEANELKRKHYNVNKSESLNPRLQENLINETNSGIVVKDAAHLKVVLKDLYAEFKLKGFIECNSINTEQFSRKIQVQKLAEIVHKIIDSKEKS